jgi:diguanylate cyclase (GGDEF)-like protein
MTSRVELTRRYLSVDHGPMSTMGAVWALPAALVLRPGLATLLAAVVATHVILWKARTASSRVHRAVFGEATGVLATLAASVISGAVGARAAFWSFSWPAWAPLGVLAAVVAYTLVNAGLVVAGMYAATRPVRLRTLLLSRDDFGLECATLVLGVFVAVTLTRTPWLTPAIAGVLILLQRSALVAKLTEAASQDGKTGLLNAATWEQRAGNELRRAERDDAPAALLLIDLDHFKSVNDTYGHLAGDEALRAVAAVLTAELRGHDLVARYGGEEFAVLVPGASPQPAVAVAERIRRRIARAHPTLQLTASIGVAHYPAHGGTVAELFAVADRALYAAKNAGRDRVSVGAHQLH